MAKDRIALEGLRVHAWVGVYPHEMRLRQLLHFDITIGTDVSEAAASDDVSATIDYDRVAAIAREIAGETHHRLIETIADQIARAVLQEFRRAEWAKVRVRKPDAVPDADYARITVLRTRKK